MNPQLQDHDGDVEQIRNPKATLKGLFPSCSEVNHGAGILGKLDIPHIVSHVERCGYLRSLFAWCVKHVSAHVERNAVEQPDYRLEDGVRAEVTSAQYPMVFLSLQHLVNPRPEDLLRGARIARFAGHDFVIAPFEDLRSECLM